METDSSRTEALAGEPIHVVVYVSSSARLLSQEDLTSLLAGSRKRNREAGITGLLLYKDGNIMQLLEGPKAAVVRLMEKITADPRHRGVIVLLEEDKREREFGEWSMGFKKVAAVSGLEMPGYVNFAALPLTDPRFVAEPSGAVQLLQHFRKILE